MLTFVTRTLSHLRLLLALWAFWGVGVGPLHAQVADAAGGLPGGVLAALAGAGVPPSALSVVVVSLGADAAERLRYRSDVAVNPASVMKLVTTYAAIDLLGPDFTWNTRFYTDGEVGQGALRGNLYVRGGGDPKLVLERIQAAFTNLQDQGVRVILGDMVLDHSAFELPAIDPGAFDGEALRPYNAAPDALLVNFKSVVLTFTPDAAADVARVRSEPPLAGLSIDATVPLSRSACGDWRGSLQARFDDANRIQFAGRFPASCGERVWPVAYQDPASYAARALEGLWRASGGALTGTVRAGLTPPAQVGPWFAAHLFARLQPREPCVLKAGPYRTRVLFRPTRAGLVVRDRSQWLGASHQHPRCVGPAQRPRACGQ